MTPDAPNQDQRDYWNREEAHHWVDNQQRYDEMLAPFGERVLAAAALTATDRVLDVGCGCGTTTLGAARAVPDGQAIGIDLSEPMTARAHQRALDEGIGNVLFEVADAQTFRHDVPFDVVISRFGVMFFDDPVAAFTNLQRGLWSGGRLAFACWQDLLENEWMFVPAGAVLEHVPMPDLGPPGAPGPFSLGDTDRVRSVLTDAGFTEIDVESAEEQVLVAGRGTIDDAVEFMRHSGLANTLLSDAPDDLRERAFASVREALAPFATDDGVRMGAKAWIVTASKD
jgi:SAM-dependent methyltransferase